MEFKDGARNWKGQGKRLLGSSENDGNQDGQGAISERKERQKSRDLCQREGENN